MTAPRPTPKTLDVGTAAFHQVWITSQMPAQIAAAEPEPTKRAVRTPPPPGGAIVRFTEMAPGAKSPMHSAERANRSDSPVRMVFVLIDGEITDELRSATGPPEFFHQVLE
ncbi:MAG TPA: hypothetical protein VME22_13125 [Solirubrobacteraceae bacterium]|nr:hypothetical protein [Solirubrobacteraceae bacterium]